jgi:hypothetical protein
MNDSIHIQQISELNESWKESKQLMELNRSIVSNPLNDQNITNNNNNTTLNSTIYSSFIPSAHYNSSELTEYELELVDDILILFYQQLIIHRLPNITNINQTIVQLLFQSYNTVLQLNSIDPSDDKHIYDILLALTRLPNNSATVIYNYRNQLEFIKQQLLPHYQIALLFQQYSTQKKFLNLWIDSYNHSDNKYSNNNHSENDENRTKSVSNSALNATSGATPALPLSASLISPPFGISNEPVADTAYFQFLNVSRLFRHWARLIRDKKAWIIAQHEEFEGTQRALLQWQAFSLNKAFAAWRWHVENQKNKENWLNSIKVPQKLTRNFTAWRDYAISSRKIAAERSFITKSHYNGKILKEIFNYWLISTARLNTSNENKRRAVQSTVNHNILRRCFIEWRHIYSNSADLAQKAFDFLGTHSNFRYKAQVFTVLQSLRAVQVSRTSQALQFHSSRLLLRSFWRIWLQKLINRNKIIAIVQPLFNFAKEKDKFRAILTWKDAVFYGKQQKIREKAVTSLMKQEILPRYGQFLLGKFWAAWKSAQISVTHREKQLKTLQLIREMQKVRVIFNSWHFLLLSTQFYRDKQRHRAISNLKQHKTVQKSLQIHLIKHTSAVKSRFFNAWCALNAENSENLLKSMQFALELGRRKDFRAKSAAIGSWKLWKTREQLRKAQDSAAQQLLLRHSVRGWLRRIEKQRISARKVQNFQLLLLQQHNSDQISANSLLSLPGLRRILLNWTNLAAAKAFRAWKSAIWARKASEIQQIAAENHNLRGYLRFWRHYSTVSRISQQNLARSQRFYVGKLSKTALIQWQNSLKLMKTVENSLKTGEIQLNQHKLARLFKIWLELAQKISKLREIGTELALKRGGKPLFANFSYVRPVLPRKSGLSALETMENSLNLLSPVPSNKENSSFLTLNSPLSPENSEKKGKSGILALFTPNSVLSQGEIHRSSGNLSNNSRNQGETSSISRSTPPIPADLVSLYGRHRRKASVLASRPHNGSRLAELSTPNTTEWDDFGPILALSQHELLRAAWLSWQETLNFAQFLRRNNEKHKKVHALLQLQRQTAASKRNQAELALCRAFAQRNQLFSAFSSWKTNFSQLEKHNSALVELENRRNQRRKQEILQLWHRKSIKQRETQRNSTALQGKLRSSGLKRAFSAWKRAFGRIKAVKSVIKLSERCAKRQFLDQLAENQRNLVRLDHNQALLAQFRLKLASELFYFWLSSAQGAALQRIAADFFSKLQFALLKKLFSGWRRAFLLEKAIKSFQSQRKQADLHQTLVILAENRDKSVARREFVSISGLFWDFWAKKCAISALRQQIKRSYTAKTSEKHRKVTEKLRSLAKVVRIWRNFAVISAKTADFRRKSRENRLKEAVNKLKVAKLAGKIAKKAHNDDKIARNQSKLRGQATFLHKLHVFSSEKREKRRKSAEIQLFLLRKAVEHWQHSAKWAKSCKFHANLSVSRHFSAWKQLILAGKHWRAVRLAEIWKLWRCFTRENRENKLISHHSGVNQRKKMISAFTAWRNYTENKKIALISAEKAVKLAQTRRVLAQTALSWATLALKQRENHEIQQNQAIFHCNQRVLGRFFTGWHDFTRFCSAIHANNDETAENFYDSKLLERFFSSWDELTLRIMKNKSKRAVKLAIAVRNYHKKLYIMCFASWKSFAKAQKANKISGKSRISSLKQLNQFVSTKSSLNGALQANFAPILGKLGGNSVNSPPAANYQANLLARTFNLQGNKLGASSFQGKNTDNHRNSGAAGPFLSQHLHDSSPIRAGDEDSQDPLRLSSLHSKTQQGRAVDLSSLTARLNNLRATKPPQPRS